MYFKLLCSNLKADLEPVWIVFCEGAGRCSLNIWLIRKLHNAIKIFIEAVA